MPLRMCDKREFVRQSELSQRMERNQCKAAKQKDQLLTIAADAIRQLVAKSIAGLTLSQRDLADAGLVARSLDRLA